MLSIVIEIVFEELELEFACCWRDEFELSFWFLVLPYIFGVDLIL